MSELDEVSRSIGSLQASVEALTRAHADKAKKDDEFRQFAYQKLNGFDGIEKRLGAVETQAAATDKTVSRAKWVLSGFALAGGAAGGKIGALLAKVGIGT